MWRKLTIAGILAALALIAFSSFAFAASPNSASQTTISMQGQAVVIPGSLPSQIRLKANSNEDASWLLEVTLNATRGGSEGYRENQTLNINGSFTLGLQQQPIANGTVTGWLNTNGYGDVQLLGQNDSTSLDMSFFITQNGTVNSMVKGNWPILPAQQLSPAQPSNNFYWYLSRTAALSAYILLFISVCLGLGLKSRYLKPILGQWRTFDLHQFTMVLAGALVGLHIFSLLGDTYFSFNLGGLLVPMTAPYRPLWISLGIVGFYVGLVIVLSSCIRRFIGQRIWRILHYTSYVLFFIILFHGVKSGTDTDTTWVQWLYISTGSITAFLILLRFLVYRPNNIPQSEHRTTYLS